MTTTPTETGYAPVNGLQMYYEIHGTGGVPLVLLHGGLSGIGTSFGTVLPLLAQHRRVVAVEFQAHGHTADIDRPLSFGNLADDTAALIRHLGLGQVDLFGYSVGGGVAMEAAMRYPELVRKLVAASVSYKRDGYHPGLLDGIATLKPEDLVGSPFYDEYMAIAPHPEDFPKTLERVKEMDRTTEDWPAEAIQAIQAPTFLIFADSDIFRPEHSVEMFRLLGGGVAGDVVGLPRARLAFLPGTSHITVGQRGPWLAPMIEEFLDAPVPKAG
jgi:pimeloyl-ACP methyl ester carboxylesterase